ncbi:MAG: hypothetical protein Fur0018_11430 [Anaerolineales bacterium]
MKKTLAFLAILAVTVVALGIGAVAYAQSATPPAANTPNSDAPAGRPFGHGPGDPENNPLHDYMTNALADAFGLTTDELQALHDNGTTLMDYAAEQGMSVADFQATMQAARSTALEQAVADGVITQEQADQMSSHGPGMGFGGGQCDGSGPHGGPGMRGGNRGGHGQNAQPQQ